MNIYDFFNSPDVAEHCRRIGHTLNAVESAVMIDQCDSRTLAEKHAAYRTIIAEYPDMEIPRGNNHGYIESFHKALGDIIAYEEQIREKLLLSEPDAIYRAGIEDYDPGGYFSSYETALVCALEFVKDEEEARERFCKDRENKPPVHIENDSAYLLTEEDASKTAPGESNGREKFSINCITLHKGYINSGKYVNATVSRSGEIMRVWQEGLIPRDKDDELDLLDSCYIDIPVPFKRGDLVEVGNYGHLFGRSSAPYGGVYVLKDICRDNIERNAKRILRGDLMDMTANVYYEEDGHAECECIHFYPDLRYCRRELDGETRILKYIGLYMQDKLCLCSLLKIQKYLSSDKQISDLRNSPNLQWDLSQIKDDLLN
ncbi:MAG: hypothetical protein LBK57_07530 [Clostridiales Family XIII bacterium]|nr:hypothetical protein [Clostridiales Family XIII bacterium]